MEEFRLEQPPYLQYLSVTVGFCSGPNYILYQYISSLLSIIVSFVFSPVAASWSFRLWRWNMIDSEIEMKELGRSPQKYSEQKIVDRNLSRMSQTSCSRKKPTGGRVQTHTHVSNKYEGKQVDTSETKSCSKQYGMLEAFVINSILTLFC